MTLLPDRASKLPCLRELPSLASVPPPLPCAMPLRWDTRCRTGVTRLACASFFVGGIWYGYCTSNGYCELRFESAVINIDLIVRPSQDSSSEIGIFNLEAIGCHVNIDSCSVRGTIRSAPDETTGTDLLSVSPWHSSYCSQSGGCRMATMTANSLVSTKYGCESIRESVLIQHG